MLIIVGGTDGQTEMVVFFLGVGVPRNVGRDVWVVLNGGWGRDERGMKKEGWADYMISGGGDGCHKGVFFVVAPWHGDINVVVLLF